MIENLFFCRDIGGDGFSLVNLLNHVEELCPNEGTALNSAISLACEDSLNHGFDSVDRDDNNIFADNGRRKVREQG